MWPSVCSVSHLKIKAVSWCCYFTVVLIWCNLKFCLVDISSALQVSFIFYSYIPLPLLYSFLTPFPFKHSSVSLYLLMFPSASRPVGPCTRCSFMRRQTSAARPWRPPRTAPRSWRSSAGERSTPARSLMAGGFSTSVKITLDASTSWRRESTVNPVTGVPSVLWYSLSDASQYD